MTVTAATPTKKAWQRYVRVVHTREHSAFYKRTNGTVWARDPFLVCFAEGRMVAAALTHLRVAVIEEDRTKDGDHDDKTNERMAGDAVDRAPDGRACTVDRHGDQPQ